LTPSILNGSLSELNALQMPVWSNCRTLVCDFGPYEHDLPGGERRSPAVSARMPYGRGLPCRTEGTTALQKTAKLRYSDMSDRTAGRGQARL